MTPEERWERIEEKHLALAQSVEALTADVRETQTATHEIQDMLRVMQAAMVRMDKKERKTREAILSAITAYLKAYNGEGE